MHKVKDQTQILRTVRVRLYKYREGNKNKRLKKKKNVEGGKGGGEEIAGASPRGSNDYKATLPRRRALRKLYCETRFDDERFCIALSQVLGVNDTLLS